MSCSLLICNMQTFKPIDFRTMGLWKYIIFFYTHCRSYEASFGRYYRNKKLSPMWLLVLDIPRVNLFVIGYIFFPAVVLSILFIQTTFCFELAMTITILCNIPILVSKKMLDSIKLCKIIKSMFINFFNHWFISIFILDFVSLRFFMVEMFL